MGLEVKSDKEALEAIASKYGYKIPEKIRELYEKELKHLKIVEKMDIMYEMINFIES